LQVAKLLLRGRLRKLKVVLEQALRDLEDVAAMKEKMERAQREIVVRIEAWSLS